eukprot:TRINITY_DN2977_c0_g1_i1.p1 TRINITY_DN2977_c0_g1~~TRINITY_DN2977_c0_g1_i1.p1  ORF type:complete len:160 (+),score=23.58 TRINITY_DN2977_c0_g1_i1:183-662(+)
MFGLLSKAGGGGRKGRKGALTVLRNDGTVLEYHRRVRCSAVLTSYPNHLVCPSSAVKQQGGMLSEDEYLELGRVYFLLPNPACVVEETIAAEESVVHEAVSPVQFVISKEQLTKILGEATRSANATEDVKTRPHKPSRRTRSKQHFVASLESIPEFVAI